MDRKQGSYLFTIVLLGVTLYTVWPKGEDSILVGEYQGTTMGSIVYNVKVVGTDADFKPQIDSILVAFNQSLSTYIPDSEISRFNRDSKLESPSRLFQDVMKASKSVYEVTHGSFDPTIGPLIKAWGFGPGKKVAEPDSAIIDSLLLTVGFEKLNFSSATMDKEDDIYLDFSAIAKGQAVDEVGKWLESRGIQDYMVEIGGEIRCRGINAQGSLWRIGIQDPRISEVHEKLAIASLENVSVATSGNYRNYYERDGKIRAHIVDPMTGYTAEHNLLSASVFHPDCMISDAYATAFMVMGLEEAVKLVEGDENLEALFIYMAGDELDVYVSGGMSERVDLLLE